jgi:TPR repeat protein
LASEYLPGFRVKTIKLILLQFVMASCLVRVAEAQTTPSLTKLTPAQFAEQMSAVHAYDRGDFKTALPIFEKLAAIGDARSETDLGEMYFFGLGVPQDQDHAFELQYAAVAQNYGKAEDNLGNMYANHFIFDKAFIWFTKSAGHGDPAGEADLANAYTKGLGTTPDQAKALHWALLSAEQGNAFGENLTGFMYDYGLGTTRNTHAAMHYFQLAASQNLGLAQQNIGLAYQNGDGVPVDYAKARYWFKKAELGGCVCAYTDFGYMYQQGLGVTQSDKTAFQFYQRAATGGDALGENNLGAMYDNGLGVQQNAAKALYWYQQAALQGNALAEENLGTLYSEGQGGLEQNSTMADRLFLFAFLQGQIGAAGHLGDAYFAGIGVPRDLPLAAQFYDIAANSGDLASQYNMGWVYQKGLGVPQNYQIALEWELIVKTRFGAPGVDYDAGDPPQIFTRRVNKRIRHDVANLNDGQITMAEAQAIAWLQQKHVPFDKARMDSWIQAARLAKSAANN